MVKRGGNEVDWTDGPRRLVARRRRPRSPTEHDAEAIDAEHPLFILYTSGTTGKPKGILHTTGGYLTQAAYTAQRGLRPQARDRRVLVHRRHRLGHRPLLHRLRAAVQRRHPGDLRGHARTPRTRAAAGRSSQKYGVTHPLHRADRDPDVHEVGRGHPGEVRPVARCGCSASVGEPINPEAWIWYRRVIGGDRTPGRRHLVADRDRRDDDQPAARRHRRPSPARRPARCPASAPRWSTTRASRCPTAAAACWCSPSRGRRCCAASGATPSATGRRTGRASPSRATTSPATGPRRTTTATCGCSAASTTS